MKKLTLLLLTAALCCESFAQEPCPSPDSKTLGCEVCDVLPGPIKIGCQDGKVNIARSGVTLTRCMKVTWAPETEGTLWAITFRNSPCGRHSFDPAHPACEIGRAKPGRYVYKVRLKGCRTTATGTITVVAPGK